MKSLDDPHILYRNFAENVLKEEHGKKRPDGCGCTYRNKLALGMLELLDHMAHKRELRWNSEKRKEDEHDS